MREDWTVIYQTHNQLDADRVRGLLENAGFRVAEQAETVPFLNTPSTTLAAAIVLMVAPDDADDARSVIREQANRGEDEASTPRPLSVAAAAEDVLRLRMGRSLAGCKYCGIPTLDLREDDLGSRQVAILRAAGLGVNSASFSDFEPGERICTECAAHEVECDVCGRQVDGFLDGGVCRRADADEAYVCSSCTGRLDDALDNGRDW